MKENEKEKQKISGLEIAKEQIKQLCTDFHQSPSKLVDYLLFSSKFYKYSARNTMLIYFQNPFATFVSSKTKFQEMGFTLKKINTETPFGYCALKRKNTSTGVAKW